MSRPALGLWLLLAAAFFGRADDLALIGVGERWHYSPGITEPSVPPTAWREVAFDDRTWLVGGSGFGLTSYGENTLLNDATGLFTAAYFRKQFLLEDPARVRWLTLRLDWQGGFVAHLNGHEVLRRNLTNNAAGFVPFNQLADERSAGGAVDFDLTPAAPWLVAGANVLTIQVNGSGNLGSRLVLVPELVANFNRGPMVQNVFTDRASIAWQTPVPAAGLVEFGTTEALGSLRADEPERAAHSVSLAGLAPGTRYYYRVTARAGTNTVIAPTFSFQTLPAAGDLKFLLLGDSGSGSAGQFAVAEQLAKHPADVVFHLGDVVYPQFSFPYTDTRCLSVYRPLMRSLPFFFVWGNHDLYAGVQPFITGLHPPTNNVSAADHLADHTLPEFYHSFEAGEAHFAALFQPYFSQYVLTTNSPQYRWLEADLAASRKPWKFLLLHHPLKDSGVHRFDDYNFNGLNDCQELAAVLYPLAAKYGVPVVFAGHDHNFQRFRPVAGVHHFISGGGGSSLYGLRQLDAASTHFASRYHLLAVELAGDVFRMTAVGAAGEVFDALEFRRTAPDSEDPDGDGLGNDLEAVLGTNPYDPDTDGDGLSDGWEWVHGTNPLSASGPDGAGGDRDGDGLSNLGAMVTTPPAKDPVTLFLGPATSGALTLRWLGTPGQKVQLEAGEEAGGAYAPMPEFGPARSVTSGRQDAIVTVSAGARFYRLRLLP